MIQASGRAHPASAASVRLRKLHHGREALQCQRMLNFTDLASVPSTRHPAYDPACVSLGSCRGRHPTLPVEYFVRPHTYARTGILTHALSALPTIAVQNFPSFWQGIRSAEYLRLRTVLGWYLAKRTSANSVLPSCLLRGVLGRCGVIQVTGAVLLG